MGYLIFPVVRENERKRFISDLSTADLARFGHLVACGGFWNGEKLIDAQWLRNHGGGNASFMGGENTHYTAIGRVTTEGIAFPFPEDLFAEPIRVG